jgi:hypothetical protein
MYPSYLDFYEKLIPAGLPLLDRIGAFLGGKKATLESLKDPYGISEMSDPVLPSFVEPTETAPAPAPAPAPQQVEVTDQLRELAFQKKAPGTTPESLKDYYSAQKAVGAAEKEGLKAVFKDSRMKEWAEANPDLALRLIQKRAAKGMATVQGKQVPLEEEATVEMSPMERIKFIQGGFR